MNGLYASAPRTEWWHEPRRALRKPYLIDTSPAEMATALAALGPLLRAAGRVWIDISAGAELRITRRGALFYRQLSYSGRAANEAFEFDPDLLVKAASTFKRLGISHVELELKPSLQVRDGAMATLDDVVRIQARRDISHALPFASDKPSHRARFLAKDIAPALAAVRPFAGDGNNPPDPLDAANAKVERLNIQPLTIRNGVVSVGAQVCCSVAAARLRLNTSIRRCDATALGRFLGRMPAATRIEWRAFAGYQQFVGLDFGFTFPTPLMAANGSGPDDQIVLGKVSARQVLDCTSELSCAVPGRQTAPLGLLLHQDTLRLQVRTTIGKGWADIAVKGATASTPEHAHLLRVDLQNFIKAIRVFGDRDVTLTLKQTKPTAFVLSLSGQVRGQAAEVTIPIRPATRAAD